MSGNTPTNAVEQKAVSAAQAIEAGHSVARIIVELALEGKFGDPASVETMRNHPQLKVVIENSLASLSQGLPIPDITMPEGPKWPASTTVYESFGLKGMLHGELGDKPCEKHHLKKPMTIPHIQVHNGSWVEDQLTLEKLIEILRCHFDVTVEDYVLKDAVELRKQINPTDTGYQIRFDERKQKDGELSGGPESYSGGIGSFFRDQNRIPMTLRECLLICYFYWLSTDKQSHLFPNTDQVCAGTLHVSGEFCFIVKTGNLGLSIKPIALTDRSHGRFRQVALQPGNKVTFPERKVSVRKETARITLPPEVRV